VLALDESTITAATGTKRTRLRRVEVEVDGDEPDGLAPFVERLLRDCRLQPATYSKYEAALLVTDIQPQAPELGLTRIDPRSSTVGEVALAVVRRHFAALLDHEPGTRLGDDSEELHDMRVASRRLRAALSLFTDVLPQRVLRGEEDLRWVGGTLGEVRDLDVQLEQLAQWLDLSLEPDRAALEPLRERLERERASARTRMLESLDSRRYESFVKSFRRALLGRPPRGIGPWREPVLAAAPPLIEGRFHTFAKAGKRIEPTSAAADYHRLRIRGKRLRYALEFFADAYPDEAGKLIKRLVALQDILGLNQDAEVAIARLRALASDAGQAVDKTTVFAMGEIAERYRRETVALRKRVPAAYAKVVGKSWRTLEKAMLRERDHPVGMIGSGGGSGSVPTGAG
jgi:CHAD domain-containing protein